MNKSATRRLMDAEDDLDFALRNHQYEEIARLEALIVSLQREARTQRVREGAAWVREQLGNAFSILNTSHEQK